MDSKTEKKLAQVEQLAKSDPKYLEMLEQMREMEDRIDELEQDLSVEQRNLIWDFWGLSSAMDHRKLVLACLHMEPIDD